VVTSFWSDPTQDLSSAQTLVFTPSSNPFTTKSNPIPGHGSVYSSSSSLFALFAIIFYSLLLLIFIQAWTDVRLTSPQLSREALYKLALKNLDIKTVSSRHVFRFRLFVSLLASNVEIVCLVALLLCSLWFLNVWCSFCDWLIISVIREILLWNTRCSIPWLLLMPRLTRVKRRCCTNCFYKVIWRFSTLLKNEKQNRFKRSIL